MSEKSKVLIVDDQIAPFLEACLKRNHDITTAEDGESAIKEIRSKIFDLIISDYNFPGGSEFRSEMTEKSDEGRLPPVLLISARQPEDIDNFENLGWMTSFLPKPFGFKELRERVEQLLNS